MNKEYWTTNYDSANVAVNRSTEQFDMVDKKRYETGNYFKTEEEAREKLEHIKIEQQLKDIALRLNNGVEIDWEDDNQIKYFIVMNYENDIIITDYHNLIKGQGIIYCLDRCFRDIAVEEIGEDRLKNYLKEC